MILEETIQVVMGSQYGVQKVDVDIYEHQPTLIGVCTSDGGVNLSIYEARELIKMLQRAIDTIEGLGNVGK